VTRPALEFATVGDIAFEEAEQRDELIARVSDLNRRMQQLEAADGNPLIALVERIHAGIAELVSSQDDFAARLSAFDERLTAVEKRMRRPPSFPVSLIVNDKPDPVDHPAVRSAWQRQIEDEVGRQLRPTVLDVQGHSARLNGVDGTFDRMRAAFKAIEQRVAALEAAGATNVASDDKNPNDDKRQKSSSATNVADGGS
jgi:hypothetical protein